MTANLRPALLLLIAALAGCGGGGNGGSNVLITGAVRLVNSVPDSPALTLRLESGALASVDFAQASGLTQVAARQYRLTVQYTPPDGDVVTVLSDQTLTVQEKRQYSVVLLGSLAQARLLIVDEAEPEDVAAGQAEVHFVHGASVGGSVDFYLTDAGADLAATAPTVTVNAGAASSLSTVPASGSARLRVTTAGSKTVLYDSGAFALDGGVRRLFVLTDYFGPGGTGVRAIAVGNTAASTFASEALPAQYRVANFVADLSAIDVYAEAVAPPPVFAALAEGTVSDPVSAAAGSVAVTVTPEADTATTLVAGTLPLVAAQARTLVVAGLASAGNVGTRAVPDLVRPIAGQAQLRIVQASRAAGNVDFHLVATGTAPSATSTDLAALAFLSSGEMRTQPGTFDAFFTTNGATTVVAGPVAVTVGAGGLYTLFLADLVGGGTPPRVIPAGDFLE